MFDELRNIRNEQIGCSRGIFILQQTMIGLDMKVGQVIDVTNAQTELLKTLAFRSINIEARSRRNNLIFRGLPEKIGENCFDLIFELEDRNLDMNTNDFYISRAQRLGAKNPNKQIQSRPVIVCFRDYCDTESKYEHSQNVKRHTLLCRC